MAPPPDQPVNDKRLTVQQTRRENATSNGDTLVKEPGHFVPHRDRRTRKKRLAELDNDLTYTANELDRDVVSENQIRLVIQTFKDKLFTDIFPGRTEVPKTLVFAKTDLHADDITKIIREVFGKGNDFCQKITSKTTGRKPDELLNEFRNAYYPRIAVTVDMIATGTDVKPLECLLFMRNIVSASYFEQMKGRGCRIIKSDDLQSVTPDAKHKTHFVIVDAVGVCENDKTNSKPLDRQPTVPLERIMNSVAAGMVNSDIVSTLAARLTRLGREVNEEQAQLIEQESGVSGGLAAMSTALLSSIDPDVVVKRAIEKFNTPADQEPTDEQVEQVEQEMMTAAVKPFHNPKLRDLIIKVKAALEQVIDEATPDTLLRAGFDAAAKEKAHSILADFKKFVVDNKDDIEASLDLFPGPTGR